jgi:hypothetical protein
MNKRLLVRNFYSFILPAQHAAQLRRQIGEGTNAAPKEALEVLSTSWVSRGGEHDHARATGMVRVPAAHADTGRNWTLNHHGGSRRHRKLLDRERSSSLVRSLKI